MPTATAESRAIYSTGHLAALMRIPVSRVVEIVEGLGHEPALIVNNVRHYGEAALCDLREFIETDSHSRKDPRQ